MAMGRQPKKFTRSNVKGHRPNTEDAFQNPALADLASDFAQTQRDLPTESVDVVREYMIAARLKSQAENEIRRLEDNDSRDNAFGLFSNPGQGMLDIEIPIDLLPERRKKLAQAMLQCFKQELPNMTISIAPEEPEESLDDAAYRLLNTSPSVTFIFVDNQQKHQRGIEALGLTEKGEARVARAVIKIVDAATALYANINKAHDGLQG